MILSHIPLVWPTITNADRLSMKAAIDMGGNLELLLDPEWQVQAFEEEFAEYVGCVGGVAVNSGTNALMVALNAYAEKDGRPFDEATIPSYTCRSLLDSCQWVADEVRLRDNICDVRSAQFSVSKTSTVVSHMFGTAAPAKAVIDDITLSLGADIQFDVAVCSFHRDKMISTGRGGMIVSQDTAFLERCRELAYYDTALFSEPGCASGRPSIKWSEGSIPDPGSENNGYKPAFSFGMTAMQAALGRSQLRQLPGFIERRKEIAARYTAAFREVGIETPDPDVDSVFFRYIIGVDDPASKVTALAARSVEAGRGVNPPLHRLLGLPNEQFPGAEECFSKLLSIPVHPGLSDKQVQFVLVQVLETCAP